MNYHPDLVVGRCRHIHRAAIVDDMQVSPWRKFLPQLIVIAVGVPKQREMAIVNVDLISNLAQLKRDAWVAANPKKIKTISRKTCPAPIPGGRVPSRCAW